RVFARAPAPEVLAAHQNVAGLDLLGEAGPRVAERVQVELVLADHEGRVAARDDLVRVEVIAKDPGARHLIVDLRGRSAAGGGKVRAARRARTSPRSPRPDAAARGDGARGPGPSPRAQPAGEGGGLAAPGRADRGPRRSSTGCRARGRTLSPTVCSAA